MTGPVVDLSLLKKQAGAPTLEERVTELERQVFHVTRAFVALIEQVQAQVEEAGEAVAAQELREAHDAAAE